MLPCDPAYFPQTPTKKVIRYGRCYANFAQELRIWERQQGLISRWYPYAGYYRGGELRKARTSFLSRLASPELLMRYLADSTQELIEEGLKFAASLLADRITQDGKRKRFSDGLVDPEDVWMLEDGPSIEAATSGRDNLILDEGAIRQRLPGDIIDYRAVLRSHSQIVRGRSSDDRELFDPISQDIGSFIQAYLTQSTAYQDSDLDGIRDEIKKAISSFQWMYDSYGNTIGSKTTSVSFRSFTSCTAGAPCVELSYDTVLTVNDRFGNVKTTTVLKTESRRAYHVWRAWRLYDN